MQMCALRQPRGYSLHQRLIGEGVPASLKSTLMSHLWKPLMLLECGNEMECLNLMYWELPGRQRLYSGLITTSKVGGYPNRQ